MVEKHVCCERLVVKNEQPARIWVRFGSSAQQGIQRTSLLFFWRWKKSDQVLTWLQIKSSLGTRRILLQRANRLNKMCVPDLAGSLLMESLKKKVMFFYWWIRCPWLTGSISTTCGSLPTTSLAQVLNSVRAFSFHLKISLSTQLCWLSPITSWPPCMGSK